MINPNQSESGKPCNSAFVKAAVFALFFVSALCGVAQLPTDMPEATVPDTRELYVTEAGDSIYLTLPDSVPVVPADSIFSFEPMSKIISLPPVYTNYTYFEPTDPFTPELSGNPAMEWIENSQAADNRKNRMMQYFMVRHPEMVKNNIAFMELPPKKYYGTVNPADHTIELREVNIEAPAQIAVEIEKRHWLRTFSASLQFSQAYISPNWYQGGNNNLNIIANIYYNVKLNQTYHPKLLFETTMQYKLGVNSAPDDTLRNYSISEDLLQINSTFGIKAANHWYYSLTGQFKTQLLTSYASNTYDMMSSFLSPAELNLGLGMTYNYAAANKRFTFDASISPLSYNMKVCIRPDNVLAHATFGIDPDKKYAINIGSSLEAKMMWKIVDNITFSSRIFFFTDYHNIEADWENTLAMDINRFLSTQIYVHARYDTTTPAIENVRWHKLQLKEILSFGVAYKFSTI